MTMHMGKVDASSVLYIPFATYAGATGASVTLTGLAVTDIEVYKNGSVTQRASDAGYALLDTDGIDFDGITGIHGFSIDLADNTDAGFYVAGSTYWVVVSAVTVDAQTVNFIAATFSIGPASVNVTQVSGDATAADNLETAFDDTAGPVPWLGIVDQGTAQAASGTTVTLRAASAFGTNTLGGAVIGVLGSDQGYWQFAGILSNVTATDVATIDSTWAVTPTGTITYKIFGGPLTPTLLPTVNVTQVGGTSQTAGDIIADTNDIQTRLPAALTAGGNMKTESLYEGGYVWFDTAGAAGTTSYVHGTVTNPNSSMANSRTIANALSLKAFNVTNGSTVTLDQGYNGFTFVGNKWNLALASRSIAGSYFHGASVTGVATGTESHFENCEIGAVTLAPCLITNSVISGTITVGAAGVFTLFQCGSASVAGVDTIIDFDAVGATTVGMRDWTGGIEVRNMAAGDVLSLNGMGRLTVAASCTAGSLFVSGMINLVNNGSGQTIADTSRYNEDQNVANVTGTVASVTGNVGGNVVGSVGSVVGLTAANLDVAVSTRLATAGYTAPDNTSIAAILVDTAEIGAAGAGLTAVGLSAAAVDAVWDEVVDGSTTARQSVRLANAALGGKASGLETTAAVYRDLADTKDRITATVDADGNRTAVTRDLT